MDDVVSYTPAGPTVEQFHGSNAFVRGLMGPVGSSKSSSCLFELIQRGFEQRPFKNVRSVRWVVLRSTYPELKSTTIKTCMEWLPTLSMRWDAPITGTLKVELADKTISHQEFLFLSFEGPQDIGKLKSFESTGFWLNEAGELDKAALETATQRIGRFPPMKWGGPTWVGGVMDTNPPDDDHWYYGLAEETDEDLKRGAQETEEKLRSMKLLAPKQKLYDFFKQPGGLMLKEGKYEENPLAENIKNLKDGYGYYFRQLANKDKEWIKVFLLGEYGSISSGKPVYPEYNDSLHCKDTKPYPGLPLILGFDYGLTPACTICQISPKGQFMVLDELTSEDMGIAQFARDVLKPFLAMNYPTYTLQGVGDPAGTARADTDEKTCFMQLAEEGITAVPASSNSPIARTGAVRNYLNRMSDGRPAFVVSPNCKVLRKGFNGGYCYERVQISVERYKDSPLKNKFSHPHDALQYAALFSQTFSNSEAWGKKIAYPPSGIV